MRIKIVQYNSPVVLSYAIFSFIVLILGILTNDVSTYRLFSVYSSSMMSPLFYLRLFGHVFGHAGFEHYFNNFLLILLVGPMIEEKYGSKKLLITIGLTAVVTGVVHMVLFDTILLGASGVVFMMILLSSYTNYREGKIPLTLIFVIFIFIGREVIEGFLVDDNISRLSHILGGMVGAIVGYLSQSK